MSDTSLPADPVMPGPDGAQMTPLERATLIGGYKPEPEPTREERGHALVAAMEHAVKHNAPVTLDMLREMRDLLDVPAPSEAPAAPAEA
jgi:hypothetical protein